MNLQTALQTLAAAMRDDDEQFNNADGDLAAKLNKLMATAGGRAKLRAALDEIPDEEETDESDEEVTANARTAGWPKGYFATGVKTRTAIVHNSDDSAPLRAVTRPFFGAKPDKKEVRK